MRILNNANDLPLIPPFLSLSLSSLIFYPTQILPSEPTRRARWPLEWHSRYFSFNSFLFPLEEEEIPRWIFKQMADWFFFFFFLFLKGHPCVLASSAVCCRRRILLFCCYLSICWLAVIDTQSNCQFSFLILIKKEIQGGSKALPNRVLHYSSLLPLYQQQLLDYRDSRGWCISRSKPNFARLSRNIPKEKRNGVCDIRP
jgi:hypothetical protein